MLNTLSSDEHRESVLKFQQTSDITEHAAGMTGWNVRYDQVSPGQFAGSITELSLNGMQLVRDKANQAMVKNGASPEGSVMFNLPLTSTADNVYCDGHSFNLQSLLVSRGECLPEIKTPSNIDVICISAQLDMLQQSLQKQNIKLNLTATTHLYQLQQLNNQVELVNLLGSVLNPDSNQSLLELPAIQRGIRDSVLQHLLELIDEEQVHYLEPLARKRVVDRARDYMMSHINEPPTIVELCNNVGASRRKLQYCFQETLGTNPVAYLRTLRLNAVHRELLTPYRTESVHDIAVERGFLHLSRFANDYKQLFGELPSETLRRTQSQLC
ncbi:helix-turn-helix domain-containing protein [uncultured Amphritea sp.]|uniref:helix-turn-helix domain-containing protein n=1 Tax=uncultured Amphritea sp. TaxID=981605 RepID=UPI00261EF682|nr:helix-turn-helix domain-containing protein [uncultured Amphritea sp.]